MKRYGKGRVISVGLLACVLLLLWGIGTTSSCFTDFEKRVCQFILDRSTPPILTVITPAGRTPEDPTYAPTASYLVTGTISQGERVSQILVNGVPAQRDSSGAWWCQIQLEDGVTQQVLVEAVDRGGRTLSETRYVRYDSAIRFEEFVVTRKNRQKVGYIEGMTELTIPETFYDEETDTWYLVVAIGFPDGDPTNATYAAFSNNTTLAKVVIPGSVRWIDRYSFYDSTGLEEVMFGYGIQEIGSVAFHGCNGLTQVILPDSITLLDDGGFMMCENLETIRLPDTLTEIPSNLFAYCSSLAGQITIPKNVEVIDKYAFRSTKITRISIPAALTVVGQGAFQTCNQLTEVYYEGTVEQWATIYLAKNNDPLKKAQIHYEMYESVEDE